MKSWIATLALVLFAVTFPAAAEEPKPSKSALEADPSGWTDLLPAADLKGWTRVPVPSTAKLKDKNPWSVDAANKAIVCDGVGHHENLQLDQELGDCIFHVEWRFKKLDGGKGYNSGVYVRNSKDGNIWHQAQVGSKNVGGLFGNTLADGKEKRFNAGSTKPQYGNEAGEWNTYELTCKGKDLTLWVNGHVTAEWKECQVPRGHLGLEAEGFVIEFRNLKLKELK